MQIEIESYWMPLILQAMQDSISHHKQLLENEDHPDFDDIEEWLDSIEQGNFVLKNLYEQNQGLFDKTVEDVLRKPEEYPSVAAAEDEAITKAIIKEEE